MVRVHLGPRSSMDAHCVYFTLLQILLRKNIACEDPWIIYFSRAMAAEDIFSMPLPVKEPPSRHNTLGTLDTRPTSAGGSRRTWRCARLCLYVTYCYWAPRATSRAPSISRGTEVAAWKRHACDEGARTGHIGCSSRFNASVVPL